MKIRLCPGFRPGWLSSEKTTKQTQFNHINGPRIQPMGVSRIELTTPDYQCSKVYIYRER